MKNILQNLLIAFAFLLCVLVAIQWTREAHLHGQVEALTTELDGKTGALQAITGQLQRSEAEVKRLEALKVELTDAVKTNRFEISGLKKDLDKTLAQVRQGEVYKDALQQANESIKKQNESILKQNEDVKKLMAERNEMVTKFNKLTAEYNDLAKLWNEQQKKLSEPATPPTAPPAK